tara:strand:+ start:10204 stop:11238 length:1035 start_codon:yes stop_codon:yes gene_type:complete
LKKKQIIVSDIGSINFDKYSRLILITGLNSFKELTIYQKIIDKYTNKKVIHIKKENNPTEKSFLINTSDKLKLKTTDCIVALGGGNVIDFSKGLKFFSNKNKIDLISIPTTCGSGSESTSFFVCYEDELKISLSSEFLIPNLVVLNHNNLLGLSKKNLISSYLDAFSQAIESFWSINSSIESKNYSFLALSHLIKAKENIIDFDENCLINAQLGAHYAGKAINISKTTAPHAFSYFFNNYGIPHGMAVNIILPFFLKEVYFKSDINLKLKLDEISFKLLKKDFSHFIIYYEDLLKFLGDYSIDLFKSISNFDYSKFIESVNLERLKNTPVEVDFNGLIKYLKTL